jgi:hypothetical protein
VCICLGRLRNLTASICAPHFFFVFSQFLIPQVSRYRTLFKRIPVQNKNSNVEVNVSSSFVRKTNVIVWSLFSFVATLQEGSHSERIYVSLCFFHINSKIHRHTWRIKRSLILKIFIFLRVETWRTIRSRNAEGTDVCCSVDIWCLLFVKNMWIVMPY